MEFLFSADALINLEQADNGRERELDLCQNNVSPIIRLINMDWQGR